MFQFEEMYGTRPTSTTVTSNQSVQNRTTPVQNSIARAASDLILDFDKDSKEELLKIDAEIAKRLKPHQLSGVKFMWNACFETLLKSRTERGSGCILAHCMGLGKTVTAIALIHALLTNPESGMKTIMIVCPKNTILNWKSEINRWLKLTDGGDDIDCYDLTQCVIFQL